MANEIGSIKEDILKNRPNLSTSSVNSYYSILKNLHKKVFKDKEYNKKDFHEDKIILNELNEIPSKKRKTILSALVIFVDDDKVKEIYRSLMMDDIKISKEETISQKKDESKDWIDWNDVKNIYNAYRKDTYYLMKSKPEELTPKELNVIQDFIILSLYVLIPPRRSLDYVELRQRNYTDEDNYIDFKKNKIYFNKYKTSKFYKTQTVDIPRELKNILKKWFDFNTNDYVLIDTNNNKLNQVKLNQRLNKIFGMKISVNALRHSYLTNKYGNIPALKDMLDTAEDMGHDIETALTYVKK
jgi:integrase